MLWLGGSGGWSPGKFWTLEAMRLHLRPFLGKYDAFWRPDDRVSHIRISTLSAHCVVYQRFGFPIIRLFHKPHPSQMRLVRLIVCFEEQKVVGRKSRKNSFTLFAAISQVLTCYLCAWGPRVGVRRAMALSDDAKQATSEEKCGPVET